MEEKIYYSKYDVKVTNARFVKRDKTYAMKNITAVSTAKQGAPINGYLLLMLAGFIVLLTSIWYIGGIMILIAGNFLIKGKPTYFLQLDTNSGKVTGYASMDKSEIDSIVIALNQSIIEN